MISGTVLGTAIAAKITPPGTDPASAAIMLETWISISNVICDFLSQQTIMVDGQSLIAPGAVTLANGGGPAAGTVVIPPGTAKMILP